MVTANTFRKNASVYRFIFIKCPAGCLVWPQLIYFLFTATPVNKQEFILRP